MRQWPEAFESLLLQFLPDHGAGQPLAADVPLVDYGLTSMAVVAVMVELEEQFDFVFPEDRATPETFYSAGSLWSVVAQQVTSAA